MNKELGRIMEEMGERYRDMARSTVTATAYLDRTFEQLDDCGPDDFTLHQQVAAPLREYCRELRLWIATAERLLRRLDRGPWG